MTHGSLLALRCSVPLLWNDVHEVKVDGWTFMTTACWESSTSRTGGGTGGVRLQISRWSGRDSRLGLRSYCVHARSLGRGANQQDFEHNEYLGFSPVVSPLIILLIYEENL